MRACTGKKIPLHYLTPAAAMYCVPCTCCTCAPVYLCTFLSCGQPRPFFLTRQLWDQCSPHHPFHTFLLPSPIASTPPTTKPLNPTYTTYLHTFGQPFLLQSTRLHLFYAMHSLLQPDRFNQCFTFKCFGNCMGLDMLFHFDPCTCTIGEGRLDRIVQWYT